LSEKAIHKLEDEDDEYEPGLFGPWEVGGRLN